MDQVILHDIAELHEAIWKIHKRHPMTDNITLYSDIGWLSYCESYPCHGCLKTATVLSQESKIHKDIKGFFPGLLVICNKEIQVHTYIYYFEVSLVQHKLLPEVGLTDDREVSLHGLSASRNP